MENYDPTMSFDQPTADWYAAATRGDEEPCVDFLVGHARGGPALELAVGTGRIALPLAGRGIRVDGIDISAPMLDRLRARPGAAGMHLVLGDFADVPFEGRYRLVYVVWNTLFNLLSQDDQVRCFVNVAEHLTDDGVFVIETGVPAHLYRSAHHSHVEVDWVGVDGAQLGVWRHDPVSQTTEGNHIGLTAGGITVNPIVQRYAWPAEIDLMARIAGLGLHERWAGWDRRPFTADSPSHVSVYGR